MTARRGAAVLGALVALLLAGAVPSSAHPVTCGTTADLSSSFGCVAEHTHPSPAPGNPGQDGGSNQPVRDPKAPYTERILAPTCSGNTRTSTDVMCQAAISNCDNRTGAAEGSLAYWVWTRLYRPGVPEGQQAPWVRQAGFVCLGGDQAPEAPTPAQVAAVVQRDFQELVVISGTTTVNPGARTLVNVDTIFSTNRTGPEALPPITILGHRVVITVTPESYTWHFGDGSDSLITNRPGRPREKDVTHVYTGPGDYEPYVVIEWSGTFTIDGGAPLTVRGRARTTGPRAAVTAVSARSELVRD